MALSALLAFGSIALSLGLAFHYVIPGLEYRVAFNSANSSAKPVSLLTSVCDAGIDISPSKLDVDLLTRFSGVDTAAGKLTTDWFIDVDQCRRDETPRVVDIFVDQYVVIFHSPDGGTVL